MLLDGVGQVVADRWIRLADDAPVPAGGAIIVPLARWLTDRPECAGLGIALPAGADLTPIVALLPRLSLVDLPFPIFRDGRSFTAARALRERYGFAGEIRASGHILPDQYVALLRVGVSTVQLPDDADLVAWRNALQLIEGSRADVPPLPWLRRAALPYRAA